MYKVFAVAAVLAAGLSIPAIAADGPTGATRHAISDACSAEVQKFCADETRAGKIAKCLKPHKSELSEQCQTALSNARQARRADRANDANDDSDDSGNQQPSGY